MLLIIDTWCCVAIWYDTGQSTRRCRFRPFSNIVSFFLFWAHFPNVASFFFFFFSRKRVLLQTLQIMTICSCLEKQCFFLLLIISVFFKIFSLLCPFLYYKRLASYRNGQGERTKTSGNFDLYDLQSRQIHSPARPDLLLSPASCPPDYGEKTGGASPPLERTASHLLDPNTKYHTWSKYKIL